MEREYKKDKILLAYLEQYEDIRANGKNAFEIADRIYSELINDGYLPIELAIAGEVADILLIDYKYELCEERSLISISNDISFSSHIDLMY